MKGQQPTSPAQISDDDDDTGIHRSYLCVFCKRGFCTAQALGGHMNIHRKDRAKISRQAKSMEEYSLLYQYDPYYSSVSQISFFSHDVLKKNYSSLGLKRNANELKLFEVDHGKKMRMNREKDEGGLDLELRLGLQPSL